MVRELRYQVIPLVAATEGEQEMEKSAVTFGESFMAQASRLASLQCIYAVIH